MVAGEDRGDAGRRDCRAQAVGRGEVPGGSGRFGSSKEVLDDEIVRSIREDLAKPPPGAWFRETSGGFSIGVSTRSTVAISVASITVIVCGMSLSSLHFTPLALNETIGMAMEFGVICLGISPVVLSMCLRTWFGKLEVTLEADVVRSFRGWGCSERNRFWTGQRSSEWPSTVTRTTRSGWCSGRRKGYRCRWSQGYHLSACGSLPMA